jgi:alpha-beta hydrolase superfamily lysophospholipase
MGGSIIEAFLHRSPYKVHIRAIVLDAPIINMQKVIEVQLRRQHLPRWFSPVAMRMAERQTHINFSALNYERPTGGVSLPTLLFHGTADGTVPVESSDRYAQARPNLVTYRRVEGADRTTAWNVNRLMKRRSKRSFALSSVEYRKNRF